MESVSGKVCPAAFSRSLNPSGISTIVSTAPTISHLTSLLRSSAPHLALTASFHPRYVALCSAPTASGGKKLDDLHIQQEKNFKLRSHIRALAMDIERATWSISTNLFQPDHSIALDEAKAQLGVMKDHYSLLREIIRDHYNVADRYLFYWNSVGQGVVSILAFMHWSETGNLLTYDNVDEMLGLDMSKEFFRFYDDIDVGLCLMSAELLRYAVMRVMAEDYDCLGMVREFLRRLEVEMVEVRDEDAYKILLANVKDFEEIYSRVKKVQGLTSGNESMGD